MYFIGNMGVGAFVHANVHVYVDVRYYYCTMPWKLSLKLAWQNHIWHGQGHRHGMDTNIYTKMDPDTKMDIDIVHVSVYVLVLVLVLVCVQLNICAHVHVHIHVHGRMFLCRFQNNFQHPFSCCQG
jgi:hypothetical protein